MSTDKKSINWYNQKAEHYAAHVRNPHHSLYHSLYEKPAMAALLPDLSSKRVLVLGCGPGEDAGYLKSQGAEEVVGIDISEKLLEIAKLNHPECEFHLMDMEHLELPDNSFDFAYSSLALHYLKDWTQVSSEIFRVLKHGSSFIFSCGHPVYSTMVITENDDTRRVRMMADIKHKDTNTAEIIGDYFTRRVIINPEPEMDVTTWHKSIGEIASECTSAGFLISAIVEPKPHPKMEQLKPRSFASLSKIPFFLIFKLEKK
jgi:ubiquinone/menaquinone biosynthesis C-methylase UbiE